MQDAPEPDEILAAVAGFLRGPRGDPERDAFQARVAANAVDLVRRHLSLAPGAGAQERAALAALLGVEGSLEALNAELAARLRDGRLQLSSPGVRAHLRAITLAKLAVDQPTYAGYLAALEVEAGEGGSAASQPPPSAR